MKIGKKYIITFEIGGKTLTFTGKIIKIDEKYVTFLDKFGKKLTYNLKLLVSFEDLENAE